MDAITLLDIIPAEKVIWHDRARNKRVALISTASNHLLYIGGCSMLLPH